MKGECEKDELLSVPVDISMGLTLSSQETKAHETSAGSKTNTLNFLDDPDTKNFRLNFHHHNVYQGQGQGPLAADEQDFRSVMTV